MGHIGNGYGSECHLLRFLGRHRDHLNKKVLEETGGDKVEWIDFHFTEHAALASWCDAELKGLEFLGDPAVKQKYAEFFPPHAQNWDAVGRHWKNGVEEVLLVEAKANIAELSANCSATSSTSVELIHDAFAETKSFLGATGTDWTKGYYQYCNRLATLYFLNEKVHKPARLLLIYFLGDRGECYSGHGSTLDNDAKPGNGIECPQTKKDWEMPLDEMKKYLGLPATHELADRIHNLFLDIRGR